VVSLEAIALQAATAAFLVSGRLSRQIPSVWARGLFAFAIVAHPNADELFGNIAHSQWYLALLVVLILCAEPATSRVQRILEGVLLAVAALTGPFPLILAPFAIVLALRDRRLWVPAAILTLGAAITFASIMMHPRAQAHSGRRFPLLARMVANQVTVGATGGFQVVKGREFDPFLNGPDLLLAGIAVAVLGVGVRRGPRLLRGTVLLGAFTLASVLISEASWRVIGTAGAGERYFFYLALAFLASLLLVFNASRLARVRWYARAVLACAAIGITLNWRLPPPHTKFDYARQIARYERVPPTGKLEIQTSIDRRSNATWTMTLVRR
jgi:hypothetical protein